MTRNNGDEVCCIAFFSEAGFLECANWSRAMVDEQTTEKM